MPAWTRGSLQADLGIKVVTVFPDNGKRGLPAIYGQYLLLDGTTGASLALLDGTMLTKRRTACASGLASRYLSRTDARRLLMIGTGALAPQLIRVHAKVRPIAEVAIWGRRPERAQRLARELSQSLPQALGRPISVRAVADRKAGRRRGRHRLLRHAFQDAPGRGRLAGRGPASRPGGGLFAADARKRRQGGAARPGLCRYPRRRHERGRRHRPAAGQRHDRRGRRDRRPVRAGARPADRASAGRCHVDHPVQVGRAPRWRIWRRPNSR